ncbi:hypothetical protein ILUMI_02868 [Ignelater luminosus]|uniref:Uncharacterized protein n=1 Tax=Ignelater luminosus TaxID=2038154 RepID=A0A8K0DC09_IGNLU|nr:hypothetical protein ILUMI_02868 [Ignelater luminosus]
MNQRLKTGSLRGESSNTPTISSTLQNTESTSTPVASTSVVSSISNETAETSEPQKIPINRQKKRKYNENYLKIGFTFKEDFRDETAAFKFEDETWLRRVTYLADTFSFHDETNATMQGSNCSVFTVQDKVPALSKEIEFRRTCLRSNIVECFPLFYEFITSNDLSVDAQITVEIILHLTNLSDELKRYFPETGNAENWIRNPFKVSPESINAS